MIEEENAELRVSRHTAKFNSVPRQVPTNFVVDGPILGNGDLGVAIGGAPERQQFWLAKNDFWRAKPLYPYFTPVFLAGIDVIVPALVDVPYSAEQDLAVAEVRSVFKTPRSTLTIRSWTPATENMLILEITCSGEPLSVDIVPWTRSGNGSRVDRGDLNGIPYLMRAFDSPELDWPNIASAAFRSFSSAGEGWIVQDVVPPADRMCRLQIAGDPAGAPSRAFSGMVSDVRIYAAALSKADIDTLSSGLEPSFDCDVSWSLSDVDDRTFNAAAHVVDGRQGLNFFGRTDSYYDAGETMLPFRPVTVSAWVLAGRYAANDSSVIVTAGDAETELSLGVKWGSISFAAAGIECVTDSKLQVGRWAHLVGICDGLDVSVYLDGELVGHERIPSTRRRWSVGPETPLLFMATVRTNHESGDPVAAAVASAAELAVANIESLREDHRAWWRSFWNESSITIHDPTLEQFYYGAHYILACCSRNPQFPPSLLGNWITSDFPAMGSDYHLNYNYQAPYWGAFSANHLALTENYDRPILDFLPRARDMSKNYLGKKGALYCVGIGPKGSCSCWGRAHDGWNDDTEAHHFFGGQKSNGLFCAINMVMRWRCTLDEKYAAKIYPFLIALIEFWEDYLAYEDGRYVVYHDSIHEWSGDDFNPILTLGMLKTVFAFMLEVSAQLKVHDERRPGWQHIVDHLSDFPVQRLDGRTVFRYTERGHNWWPDCTLGIQHIYPAGAIGLESDLKLLEISRNTVDALGRWSDGNHTMTFYPAAARVGYDAEEILLRLREECLSARGHANLYLEYGGGGIESAATVTATIGEMLLQSHQGVVHVFANWPRQCDASFTTLRTDGAFLVSARLSGGVVEDLTIVSEKGSELTLYNPWPGRNVIAGCNGNIGHVLTGERILLQTAAGQRYRFMPEDLDVQSP